MARILTVKVPLKDVQQVKRKLISKGLFLGGYGFLKDKTHAYVPINDKAKVSSLLDYPIAIKDIESLQGQSSFKDTLKSKLTEDELALVKTAYDTIGTIAILEIDEALKKKQKAIAEALLESNSSIRTVLKKASAHEGEFRTQAMTWLAGERTKEAIHKENNVTLELDVEKVYFSPRLATERKRIMQLVKPDEDILVMFSGCAPYPCVLAKNTPARNVFGIEKNPDGHRYGMENIRRNRLHNVILINGDVKDVIPEIFHYIVGMKSADKKAELRTRLVHHPVIMEFHLFPEDLFEGKPGLEKAIREMQSQGIQVVLHMPFYHDGKRYSLGQKNIAKELRMFSILGRLCRKYHVKAVVHPTQDIGIAEDEDMLVDNIRKLERWYDYFYFENVTSGLFAKTEDIIRIGRKAGIKNMTIDTCHLFIVYQDNDRVEDHIKRIRKHFNTYFHLNDHDYKTHSCEIGKGFVDFSKILPYVNLGVTEVCDRDEKHPREMVRSFNKVGHTHRKFDRILMPLPKSAEEFLPTALKVAKKGTVIHFYDFLHEKEFHIAHDKIDKACKKAGMKYRIIRTVKCGQHAPHIFRICVDFKIL